MTMIESTIDPAAPSGADRRTRRTITGVVVLLLTVLASLMTAAGTAVAADGESDTVTWSVSTPDNEQGTGRPNYQYEIAPGASIDDGVVVTNHAVRELALNVYAADGFINADGQLDLLPKADTSIALGSWVDVSAESITVAPGESVLVPFSVTVPPNISPGDYAAGVVTSLVATDADGVTVDRRLGSRMYVRVTGDIVPGLTVSDPVVSYSGSVAAWEPGSVEVGFTVTNTGNARLDTAATVQVAGPFGMGASTVIVDDLPELLPGTSMQRTVLISDVWPLMRADVDIRATGAATQDGVDPVSADAQLGAWAVPWMVLGGLVVLAGVIIFQRRRSAARRKETDDKVAVAVENALRDHGVSQEPRSS